MLTYQNIVQEYFMLYSVLSASVYQNIRISFKNTLCCIHHCLHQFIRISEYRSRILYIVFCIFCISKSEYQNIVQEYFILYSVLSASVYQNIRISFKNTLRCILYCLHQNIVQEYFMLYSPLSASLYKNIRISF